MVHGAMQVPILQGSSLLQTVDEAVAAAGKVGYPVLLKATGGGGGMGIFICHSADDIRQHFETSQHQGKAFFGNSGVSWVLRTVLFSKSSCVHG